MPLSTAIPPVSPQTYLIGTPGDQAWSARRRTPTGQRLRFLAVSYISPSKNIMLHTIPLSRSFCSGSPRIAHNSIWEQLVRLKDIDTGWCHKRPNRASRPSMCNLNQGSTWLPLLNTLLRLLKSFPGTRKNNTICLRIEAPPQLLLSRLLYWSLQ
jgi:hypothetical protein